MRVARILVGCLAAWGVLAGAAAGPAGAGAAGAYQRVLRVYERDGAIPACQFSGAQLQSALGGVDTYGAQYFADFTEAIQTALSAAASGACGRPTQAAAGSPGARPGARLDSGAPARLGSITAATSAGVPAPLLAMGVLAVAMALFSGAWQLQRRRAR